MWLIFDLETGAELRREGAEPELAEGEGAAPIPASAMGQPPVCTWSPAARGFVDVPEVTGARLLAMLTMLELQAITADPDPEIRALVLLWLVLLAGGATQRVNSPLHMAGAAQLHAKGHLDAGRYAQFAAGDLVQTT